MQREWMTEFEWRTQKRKFRRPDWWGAQCIYPTGIKRLLYSRMLQRWMVTSALMIGLMLPMVIPYEVLQSFNDLHTMEETAAHVRTVNAIAYQLPWGLQNQQRIFSREQLLRGKMLLVNQRYPLPDDLLPPNTASIALRGNGMVPVHSLQIQSGYETIEALQILFEKLRTEGVDGLYVHQGTVSKAQQTDAAIQQMRELMQTYTPEQAAALVWRQKEKPGSGSLLQEYVVEIVSNDGKLLENSPQGQKLLQLCWRYGFVRENRERPFRFRYVGKAHATAITYLDLDLESYLEWMHQKRTLVVYAGGKPQYLILCQPMQGEYTSFDLPVGADYEVSMDNTGYALAACAL